MRVISLAWRGGQAGVVAAVLAAALASHAQTDGAAREPHVGPWRTAIPAIVSPTGSQVPAPWRVVGLPFGKPRPLTQFESVTIDGERALRIQTQASYAHLVHVGNHSADRLLQWQWRLDEPLTNADIGQKSGDDSALKVCVMFDHKIDRIPFWERTLLQWARRLSGEELSAATLCYLWDSSYPEGTRGANAYTRRLRYIVLRGPTAPLKKWVAESRNIAQDFLRLFGDEASEVPTVLAVLVGADADSTQGESLGYLRDLRWQPP